MVIIMVYTCTHKLCTIVHIQGFIQDFPFGGGGGGISIYEKEGCVMRKRGVGDKSLCQ